MKAISRALPAALTTLVLLAAYFGLRSPAGAHCDTMDGPVVKDARRALNTKDVTPTLKWVAENQEAEIKRVFNQAVAVRGQSAATKAVADALFFENLVRIHRASEGEPYTGVKPAGTDPGPAIRLADRALEAGKVDELVRAITAEVGNGIRRRFSEASEKRKHAEHNVSAGREFVSSYVEFTHYVDGIHAIAAGSHGQHEEKAVDAHKH